MNKMDNTLTIKLRLCPTIFTFDIAEAAEKTHESVIRDVHEVIQSTGYENYFDHAVCLDTKDGNFACYMLTRKECDLVVSGYTAQQRKDIDEYWFEIERIALL